MTRQPFNPDLIRTPAAGRDATSTGPITVSQLTTMVKDAIASALPRTLHVVGEISNFKRHGSGHVYLTLKDPASEVSCVIWRNDAAKLKFAPRDGLEVIATGTVDVFERTGRYQLYVRRLEPRGIGALELAFRQLREKLAAEGLFEARHKRPLPAFPRRIVIVTSPTGAAVADILRTVGRRYPCVDVLLYPVRVQGEDAAGEIAAAVRTVDSHAARLGGVDVMIVGRGGGSIEDLWAFNEEVVARAIYACRIPVISAVGHEVDVSIADLVADVRAATPTAAAELAVPVRDDVMRDVENRLGRMSRALRGRLELADARLSAVTARSAVREPLAGIRRREQFLDELSHGMQQRCARRLLRTRAVVDALERTVQRIAPHAYLLHATVRSRDAEHRLRWALARRLVRLRERCEEPARRIDERGPHRTLPTQKSAVKSAARRLDANICHSVALIKSRLQRGEHRLAAMSYRSILNRGFSITRTKKGKTVVRSPEQVTDRQRLVTELADGQIESEIVNLTQLELFD